MTAPALRLGWPAKDRQILAGELVDDVEHAKLPSVVGAVLDEVVRSDMVVMREQSLSQSRPFFGCFWGTFSPSRRQILSTLLRFTGPAGSGKQRRNAAVAVTAILSGERNDIGSQSRFIIGRRRNLTLCGPMLAENPASRRSDTRYLATTWSTQAR
jgi:hypothetical protein